MARTYTPGLLLFLIAASALALCAYVLNGPVAPVQAITSEDAVVENLTAICFGIGAIAAIVALIRGKHRLVAGTWLVLCVLFVGEETSWFQRTIGYNVPTIEQRNSQGEFNLHNLDFMHGSDNRTFLSEDGKIRLGWKRFMTSQTLFRLGFLGYFFLLPALMLFSWPKRLAEKFNIPQFDWHMLVTLWTLIALTVVMTLVVGPDKRLAAAETRELLYAITIALYVIGVACASSAVSIIAPYQRRAHLPPETART